MIWRGEEGTKKREGEKERWMEWYIWQKYILNMSENA